jgi:hypothetical protein
MNENTKTKYQFQAMRIEQYNNVPVVLEIEVSDDGILMKVREKI